MATVASFKKKISILLTDAKAGQLVSKLLAARGFDLVAPGEIAAAPDWAVRPSVGAVLVDYDLPGGLEDFLTRMKAVSNAAAVLVSDAQPSVERALAVRQLGAFDYLTFPFPAPDLVDAFNRSLSRLQSLRRRHVLLDAYLVANGAVPPSDAEEEEQAEAPKSPEEAKESETAAAPGAEAAPAAAPVPEPVGGRPAVLAEELALLAALVENHAVPKELGDRAREALGKSAALDDGPISALRELELLDENLADRIIAAIADLARVPPVDLSVTDYSAPMLAKCDRRALRLRSAVPIGRIGEVRLVAMANPYSAAERDAVRAVLGGECRFYVCSGLAVEAALEEPEEGAS